MLEMGEKNEAVKWLERAVDKHEGMCVKLKQNAKDIPWFNTDQRIQALFKMSAYDHGSKPMLGVRFTLSQ